MSRKVINELHLDEAPTVISAPSILVLGAIEDGSPNGVISEVQQLGGASAGQVPTADLNGDVSFQDIPTQPIVRVTEAVQANGSTSYTFDNGLETVTIWNINPCADSVKKRVVTVTPADGDDSFDATVALNLTSTEEIISAEITTGDVAFINIRGTTLHASRNYSSDSIRVVIIETCV